jgi:hypothetical protein
MNFINKRIHAFTEFSLPAPHRALDELRRESYRDGLLLNQRLMSQLDWVNNLLTIDMTLLSFREDLRQGLLNSLMDKTRYYNFFLQPMGNGELMSEKRL